MKREPILKTLSIYHKLWIDGDLKYSTFSLDEEQVSYNNLVAFIKKTSHCFERYNLKGHVTGSALICNLSLDQVLLTHHKKLNRWLQLGGHADGDHLIDQVALKEGEEESGLKELKIFPYEQHLNRKDSSATSPIPFDIDIHLIPENQKDKEHFHYDIRYLLVADRSAPIEISEESNDLKWFTLEEAKELTQERSMLRQFYKLDLIREKLLS